MRFSKRHLRESGPPVRRQRRGATMVLVAITATVLFMFGGLGMDIARMHTFTAQLKTLADAGSLAAVAQIPAGNPITSAYAAAIARRTNNTVDGGHLAIMGDTNIEPGVWDWGARTFTPLVPAQWASANAVRASARYNANWTLAKIFGVNTKALRQASVASFGSVAKTGCMKPWAVPYTNMLRSLRNPAPDTSYRLTAADVAYLRTNNVVITFKVDATIDAGTVDGVVIPGNYYSVQFPALWNKASNSYASPGPVSGGNAYRDQIADLTCQNATINVGDSLDLQNGVAAGPTVQGMRTFCGGTGNSFPCNKKVVVPIWNGRNVNNASAHLEVLYVGEFDLISYNSGTVTGYLRTMRANAGTGFLPIPGPVPKILIVQ
jgi:Flp pilus assembly protein TadG